MSVHEHADKLIYAADMYFEEGLTVEQMIHLADAELDRVCEALDGLGVTIKGNTIFRLIGAKVFERLDQAGCFTFADYKLFDVQSTCKNEASWLRNLTNLDVLTVNIDVHPNVFTNLAETLPLVTVAPVKPLTDLSDEIFRARGDVDRETTVRKFFEQVMTVRSNGLISSPTDLALAPEGFCDNRVIITPGIRPLYMFVKDDTNAINALTPTKAIQLGASKLVVGSPIRHNNQIRSNSIRILDEIGEAVEKC